MTNRTTFQSIGLSCTNRLMTRFWANRFVQFSQFCGRNLTLTAQEFFTNSPDDRTAYEGLSGQSITLTISNGTHSMSFVMNTNNIFTSVEDSLPLADIYTQTLTATSQWDPAYTGQGRALFRTQHSRLISKWHSLEETDPRRSIAYRGRYLMNRSRCRAMHEGSWGHRRHVQEPDCIGDRLCREQLLAFDPSRDHDQRKAGCPRFQRKGPCSMGTDHCRPQAALNSQTG